MRDNFIGSEYRNHDVIWESQRGGCLVLGDFNAVTDAEVLGKYNIRTIITAAEGMEHLKVDKSVVRHIIYPLYDVKKERISLIFDDNFSNIDENLLRGGVLVHCAAGVSRSATLVIAYLMRKMRWSFKQAITYVKKKRPVVCPNLGFQMQLKMYEKQVYQTNHPYNNQSNKQSKSQSLHNKFLSDNNPNARKYIFEFLPDLPEFSSNNKIVERESFPRLSSLIRTQMKRRGYIRNGIQSRDRQKNDNTKQQTLKINMIVSSLREYGGMTRRYVPDDNNNKSQLKGTSPLNITKEIIFSEKVFLDGGNINNNKYKKFVMRKK